MNNELNCMHAYQAERAENKTVLVSKASLLTGTKADAGKDDSQSLFSYGCVCCTCILSHTRLYAAPSVQGCCQYITSLLQTSCILEKNCSSISLSCSDIQPKPES